MALEDKYRAIKRKLNSVGLLGTIRIIYDISMRKVAYRNFYLYYLDLNEPVKGLENFKGNIIGKKINNFNELSDQEIESIKEYAGVKYIKECERRLENNCKFYVASINDQLAGGVWAFDNDSEYKTKAAPLFDDDIATGDGWTLPNFRGKNLLTFLLLFVADHSRAKGYRRIFGDPNERNFASIKSCEKAGFKKLIKFESYKILGKEVVIWKPDRI